MCGLLAGCENPSATFDAFRIAHPQNLERRLGSRLQLLSATDTLDLRVHFDVASQRNIITYAATGDTLLEATALRYRQLYYLVQQQPKAGCWVHAVRIRGNEVQGLASGWEQMADVSQAVREGQFSELVRYRNLVNDSARVRFDAKQLREFYTAEIDSFPVYHAVPQVAASGSQTVSSKLPALYPNPARDYTTLDFAVPASRVIHLFSATGQLLYRTETKNQTVILPVAQFPVGHYVVRSSSSLRNENSISQRLLIMR